MIDLQTVEWAMREGRRYVPWLRAAGNLRGGDPDELRGHSKPGPGWVLPATWVAAEEISRIMGELNRWPELEDALFDPEGVEWCDALVFEVRVAVKRWPLEEKPHRIRTVRCPGCGQMTLRYLPAMLHAGQVLDVVVRCNFEDCRTELSESSFAELTMLLIAEQEARAATVAAG